MELTHSSAGTNWSRQNSPPGTMGRCPGKNLQGGPPAIAPSLAYHIICRAEIFRELGQVSWLLPDPNEVKDLAELAVEALSPHLIKTLLQGCAQGDHAFYMVASGNVFRYSSPIASGRASHKNEGLRVTATRVRRNQGLARPGQLRTRSFSTPSPKRLWRRKPRPGKRLHRTAQELS
jgi:hypothetical protein